MRRHGWQEFGMGQAMKSGIGSASIDIGGGVIIGAIFAVNAFGDVVNPHNGQIIAGARPLHQGPLKLGGTGKFANTLEIMKSFVGKTILGFAQGSNTVIGVVATNAKLDKERPIKSPRWRRMDWLVQFDQPTQC